MATEREETTESNLRLSQHFGRTVAARRQRLGISQEELSFRASLHRTEIGQLERGMRMPRLDTIVKLAGSLEIDLCELLAGLTALPGVAALNLCVAWENVGDPVGPQMLSIHRLAITEHAGSDYGA